MNKIQFSIAAVALSALTTSAYALKTEKRDMKNNMSMVYKQKAKSVDNIQDMFSEGTLFGRLRSNMFMWDWENDNPGRTKDNESWGVGGSLLYSTANLLGFGATVGLYTTHTIGTDNTDVLYGAVDFGKAGKDTYSRADGSGASIDSLAIAYLEYQAGKTDIKAGRQIFESTLLRSNDTKMIPNTFEGITIVNKDLPKTTLRAAYFTRQKLRDHSDFHSVIAVNGYSENDDSAKHGGLSTANISTTSADNNPRMLVLTAQNKSIDNLKLNFDYMNVNDFVSSMIVEANYKIKLNDGWSVTPGARYMNQMDEGAGAIGGAALSGRAVNGGYSDPNNVDGSLTAVRVKVAKGAGNLTLGYSKISDDADIIAPWRGFPTGGYTRSMAQYNWEADTVSWMLKAYYDFGKAKMVPGLRVALDYAEMDYDERKLLAGSSSKTDRNIIHLDMFKTFESIRNLELKFRAAIISADSSPAATKDFNSYNEARFEVNYFF